MDEWTVILYIIIANIIVALLYFILMRKKANKRHVALATVFMLFCPVIGPGYLFFSWLVYATIFRKKAAILNPDELSFSKRRIDVIHAPELKEEEDKAPIEEVLILQNRFVKRDVLLNLLKTDYDQSLTFIAAAVENEDGEVSHYAASAITEKIDKFKAQEASLDDAKIADEETAKRCIEYIEYVYRFLGYRILSVPEHTTYSKKLLRKIKELYQYSEEAVAPAIYQYAVVVSMNIDNFEMAGKWLHLGQAKAPEDIAVYKAGLEYYFRTEAYTSFLKLLQRLKRSDVVLDNQLLEIIRFYQTENVTS